ncbi:hypothetical protein N8I77_005463 [Diaporthe amygdali]|uniref:Zn(2)-C6 fungal-type domain-containing protein n=1 Tax=Phomopsis amygdali TaxID=1214568 RepID=A0AAD9SEH8_PHOAM|nr:hypothetical protein N8I77_005463 [Diaporthe amygdali]
MIELIKRRETRSNLVPPLARRAKASHSSSSSSKVDAGRNVKRRKTRKGTRSCWACKRRKVKCTYASPTDDVCIGCARRCLDCVSQEFPEQDPGPSSKSRLVGDRIGRLELMFQQLAEQATGHVANFNSPSTPASISTPVLPSMKRSEHRALSHMLLEAYPSSRDLRIIRSTGGKMALYLPLAFLTPSYLLEKRVVLEWDKLCGTKQQQQGQQYTAETHPVLIARQLLLLAGVLQHLPAAGFARSSSSYQQLGELSRLPRVLARRLAESAMTLVTAHDRFTTNTLEGLECLWLEAVYHEHDGSLHRSWLACRRAITAMHLMGFHGHRYTPMAPPRTILQQPDGETADLQQMWLRLVYSEIALCLVIEMPPSASCPDETFTFVADSVRTEDNTTDTSKLDRRHAAIAKRLLKLSERDPNFEDLDARHQIRTELEEAASAMPSGWWHTPSLNDYTRDEADNDKYLFRTIMKLRAQIFHSHLLLLADLPSMLQATCGEATITENTTKRHPQHHRHNIGSSRDICLEASRDLLGRFIHLWSFERTAGYFRVLDHYAWQAAVTLLLAHLLDGRQTMKMTSPEGSDRQQNLSDHAMVTKAMERMRLSGNEDEDDEDQDMDYYAGVAAKSGTEDVLPRLLALEASGDAVAVTYRKPGAAFLGSNTAFLVEKDQDVLVLPIPFVGLVSVAPQVQHGSAEREGCSLLSGTMGFSPIALDDETGPQGSDFDEDGEQEKDDEDDEEAALTRAIQLRHSAKWPIAPYIRFTLRPV